MIPALLFVICVVAYRVATGLLIQSGANIWLSNFAPLAAIALCTAAYLPRRFKFVLPLAILLLSDVVLNWKYDEPIFSAQMLGRYLALGLVSLFGYALRHRASLKTMLPASIAASILFYGITNACSWLTDPGYAKNFAGLIQALTVGLPQYSATPTWMFFRHSLASDFVFTAVFVLLARVEFSRAQKRVSLARAA